MTRGDERRGAPVRTQLRIVFSMRNFWYIKLFGSVIAELASRGHAVHVLAERGEHNTSAREWNDAAETLAATFPSVTLGWMPRRGIDTWADLRLMVRLGIDYLRFLEPAYATTPKLAERARARAPQFLTRLADRPFLRTRLGRGMLRALLRAAERAMPVDPDVAAAVESQRADALLITPMLTLGSDQMDVLATARRIGLPSALCVGSWDHLSSKALLRDHPDRVFVWNDTQKAEAITLHGVAPDAVVVTGAQCFDEWFDRQPALSREAFCRKVGLDPAQPLILYVCSALFEGSPSEAAFVTEWVRALRSSGDALLRRAGVLIRPHPKRAAEWSGVDVPAGDNVAFWPPRAAAPFDAGTKADYYDSLHHAAVIVGLNTSALIEGGIVGRPVHTVLLPEFYENQEGTLHFRYLVDLGLLHIARDLPEHLEQLASALRAGPTAAARNRTFLEQFVRPHGIAVPATPLFADGVEQLAALERRPVALPLSSRMVRAALVPLARRTTGTFSEQHARDRRRHEKARAEKAKARDGGRARAERLERHREQKRAARR
jgi:hypothetical protein